MYVEIGNYQVRQGELLPTKDLSHTYTFEWEMSDKNIYAILMIDLDAPYPETPTNSPFLHFLMVNIIDINNIKEGDIVFEYLPPSPPPDSEPHRYEIYVFKQDCQIIDVWADGRTHFDIEGWTDCPLHILENFVFYGSANIEALQESLEEEIIKESNQNSLFKEYYGELSDDELLILADVYGLDTLSLATRDIPTKINQILSYRKKEKDK